MLWFRVSWVFLFFCEVYVFLLNFFILFLFFFFSSRRRHTRYIGDWSSDVCSSDLHQLVFSARISRRADDLREVFTSAVVQLLELRIDSGKKLAGAVAHNQDVIRPRSEERRVGKECRARGWTEHERKKKKRTN